MDFVRPLRPAISERTLVAVGRVVTTVIMVVAAIYAPLIAGFGSLFEYFQSTLAYLVPSIVAVYLGGLTVRRIARRSAFWVMIVMLPLGLTLFLTKEIFGLWAAARLPDLHFTYMAIVIFAVTLAALALLSLAPVPLGATPDSVVQRADFGPDAGEAAWRDHRLQAAALMALTLVLLLALG